MGQKCILEVNNLSKVYKKGNNTVIAVDSICLKAYEGEIVGLLGANGAGKTTTIKMICSLIKPSHGQILINNIDNFKKRKLALKNISAVLEGNRNIYWRLTVRENLEFFSALKGINPKNIKNEINYYINEFDLKEKENEIASKLSRGMQQKLAIATAMVSSCDLILLDEPTLGLDVKASQDIRVLLKNLAKKEKKTIIITSHDMNVVQDVCDRVIVMNRGKIVANDKVDNLMRLFNIKSYNFVIEGYLSEIQKKSLFEIEHLKIKENEDFTEISFTLEESAMFYQVISILGSENSIISSIESKEINFEEVFLTILERSEYQNDNII